MAVFESTVLVPGQPDSTLHAVLTVEDERLILTAGSHPIGDWTLAEVTMVFADDSVRLQVEGEELVLVLADPGALAETLGIRTRRPARERRRPWRRSRSHGPEARKPDPARQGEDEQGEAPPSPEEPTRGRPTTTRRVPRGLVGLALLGLALLGVFAPGILALLLMGSGGALVLAGVLAASDPYVASRLPDALTTAALLRGGLLALAASVVVIVLT